MSDVHYCDDLTPHDGSKCPICIEEFKDGDVAFMTDCNHRMCQQCSTDFLNVTGDKCPVCRVDVSAMTAYTVVEYKKPGSARDPITVGDSAETAIKVW
jgi:hypothetical protein